MTAGDLDNDRNNDLIIGSPYSSTCGDQCGFVAVLLSGKKSTQFDYFLNIIASNI